MNTATIKTDVRIQELANAYVTYAMCHGHKKAERNERLMKGYTEELQRDGVTIPSDKELGEMGVFNGQGSY